MIQILIQFCHDKNLMGNYCNSSDIVACGHLNTYIFHPSHSSPYIKPMLSFWDDGSTLLTGAKHSRLMCVCQCALERCILERFVHIIKHILEILTSILWLLCVRHQKEHPSCYNTISHFSSELQSPRIRSVDAINLEFAMSDCLSGCVYHYRWYFFKIWYVSVQNYHNLGNLVSCNIYHRIHGRDYAVFYFGYVISFWTRVSYSTILFTVSLLPWGQSRLLME